jgi:hypothetical protein
MADMPAASKAAYDIAYAAAMAASADWTCAPHVPRPVEHGKIRTATMLLKKRLTKTEAPYVKTSKGRGKQRETNQVKAAYSPQLVSTLNDVLQKWNREPDVFHASINGESRKWGIPNVYLQFFNVRSVALYIGFGPCDPAPSAYRTVVLKFNVGRATLASGKEEDSYISYCPIIKRGISSHIQESDIVSAVELVMEFFWRVSYFYQDTYPPSSASSELVDLYKDSRRLGGRASTTEHHNIITEKYDVHAKKVSDQFKGIFPSAATRTTTVLPAALSPVASPRAAAPPLAATPASKAASIASIADCMASLTSGRHAGLSISLDGELEGGLGLSAEFLQKLDEDIKKQSFKFK